MRGEAPISPIYRMGHTPAPACPEALFARVWARCRDLWIECGTIAVKPADLPDDLRESLTEWANENYGERKRG